jgi:hypothetical protein
MVTRPAPARPDQPLPKVGWFFRLDGLAARFNRWLAPAAIAAKAAAGDARHPHDPMAVGAVLTEIESESDARAALGEDEDLPPLHLE